MKSLNKVQLIGNVGKDPEVKFTSGGTAVAKFSVATNERYKENEEWKEKTEWHNVVVWERLAEIARDYVKKGDKIYLEGKSQTRSWDDKDSGQKKYMTEIVARDLILLGEKSRADNNEPPTPSNRARASLPAQAPADDFPF